LELLNPDEAAALVESGDTITVSGCVSSMVPEEVLKALELRFLASGEPNQLTEIHPWLYGAEDGTGLNRWAHDGFLKRSIGSCYILPATSKTSQINRMVLSDGLEAYCWPGNAIFQMLRAVGAGRSGFLTEIGLDTFADPRRTGGRLNSRTVEELVQLVEVDGREHLFYPSIPIDVAVIRASTADTDGNVFCDEEGRTEGILLQATAAHNCGGLVIAQVKHLVEAGTMHPLLAEVPGVLVDVVVVCEDTHQFEYGPLQGDLPATTGARRVPLPKFEDVPFGPRKIIVRRALTEVKSGHVVNIGAGVPFGLLPVAEEEGVGHQIQWSVEHGVLGGRPFGACSWNPTSIHSPAWLLDFYHGGGLDQAFLALPEVDAAGNVNVGRLDDQLPGTGGFTDIASSARKVSFLGTMTSDGLETVMRDGNLVITREGRTRKFVPNCQMVCFSGKKARERGCDVKYITERAVFSLGPQGLVLDEVAPGIDIQTQILDLCDFPVEVSPNIVTMDSRLFQEEKMNLQLVDPPRRRRTFIKSS
jgi:propionate CoA-transferase